MKTVFAVCMLAISVCLVAFFGLSTQGPVPRAALAAAPRVNPIGTAAAALTPDFSIRMSPSVDTVAAGAGTRFSVTVASVNGTFDRPVVLEATGLPPGATANFSPASVTPGARSATTIMTIQTVAQDAAIPSGGAPAPSGGAPATPLLGLLLVIPFGIRGCTRVGVGCWTALLAVVGLLQGCEGGGALPLNQTVASQATYTMKVTGSAGSTRHSVVTELLVQTGSSFNT
jgi:hypothetical protein